MKQRFRVFLTDIAQIIVYYDFPECFGRIFCSINMNLILMLSGFSGLVQRFSKLWSSGSALVVLGLTFYEINYPAYIDVLL
jgi:hypothetical protein